jgi:hypothetical protein
LGASPALVCRLRAADNGKQGSTNGQETKEGESMSGGYFDYAQYQIGNIADSIEQLIYNNNSEELNKYKNRDYTDETISEFRTALRLLRRAQIYAQRIDWLVSCDDGEGTFHKRLALELAAESSEEV